VKILLISEHYESVIGGTATYVQAVCNALTSSSKELQVDLIVPNHQESTRLKIVNKAENFHIHYLGSPQIIDRDKRKWRPDFVARVNIYLKQIVSSICPDIIHVLFGIYLIEGLEIESLKVPCCATIHSVPPRECSKTWNGDQLFQYTIEQVRLNIIKIVHYRRLLRHKYQAYIAVSYRFGNELSKILPKAKIVPIEHGFPIPSRAFSSYQSIDTCRLLTIGAYIPHKGQHLIVETAAQLRDRKLDFCWTMMGTIRVQKYYDYLQKRILGLGLADRIIIKADVSRQEIDTAYASSDIYVQPSLEEGFCFTALEAAFYQLPIVGTNEGAIPEIIRRGQGVLSKPLVSSLIDAIIEIQSNPTKFTYTEAQLTALVNHYSWGRMTDELLALYQSLIKTA